LGNQTPATALTPEQLAAYAAHARQAATQRAQFREARDEVSDAADRQRAKDPPARDLREQARDRTEQTASKVAAASREANKEMTAKEIERRRRAAAVEEMLADRKADRDRDGGKSR
jgi:hypothetical protein